MSKIDFLALDEERADRLQKEMLERAASDPAKKYDELESYMRELRHYKVLPHERFLECHAAWRSNGDRTAYEAMLYGNTRLVLSVARRLVGLGLPLLDMMQEGFFGLMRALEKFDPTMGYRFSTYATWWVRQAITRALADSGERRPFRVPAHMNEKVMMVLRSIESFWDQHGRWPDDQENHEWILQGTRQRLAQGEEVGEVVRNITLKQVRQCRRLIAQGYQSLDSTISDEDGDRSFGEVVADAQADTEAVVGAREMLAEYEAALARITAEVDKLNPREAMVLRLRYGFGEFETMTLEEIGERYELTRERIRQIEVEALRKLGELLSVTSDEIEQILAATEELRRLAGAEPTMGAGAVDEKAGLGTVSISLDTAFSLLCEHVILTPAGLRVVKAPLTTLQARGRLLYGEACAALEELATRGLVDGASPWAIVKIVPEVEIPERKFGGGRGGWERGTSDEADEVDGEETTKDTVPVATPAVRRTPLSVSEPEPTRTPRDAGGIQRFAGRGGLRRRAGVILGRLTYAEVYEVLASRASSVSGERVVRGAVPILEAWFRIWSQDAVRVLDKLNEQGYIVQRDEWRAVVLLETSVSRTDLLFGTSAAVSSRVPEAVRVAPAAAPARTLRMVAGGGAALSEKPAGSALATPMSAAGTVSGARHAVLDTAIRWIEQELPRLRDTLGEAHERLVRLEVAHITLKRARDGHAQAADAVEGAIAEMESAMQEFFTLLRQGGGT